MKKRDILWDISTGNWRRSFSSTSSKPGKSGNIFLPGSFEKLTHGVEALYSFDEASGQGRRSNCCRLKPKTKSKQRTLKSVNEVCLSQEKIFSPVGQSSREVEPPSPGPGLSSLSRVIVFHLLALPSETNSKMGQKYISDPSNIRERK